MMQFRRDDSIETSEGMKEKLMMKYIPSLFL